jgi:hypothetical protein
LKGFYPVRSRDGLTDVMADDRERTG